MYFLSLMTIMDDFLHKMESNYVLHVALIYYDAIIEKQARITEMMTMFLKNSPRRHTLMTDNDFVGRRNLILRKDLMVLRNHDMLLKPLNLEHMSDSINAVALDAHAP